MPLNLDPNLLLSIGSGLLSGGTSQQQVAGLAQNLGAYNQFSRQKATTEADRNKTLEFLRTNAPELYQAAASGAIPIGEAFGMHLKATAPKPAEYLTAGNNIFQKTDQGLKPVYQIPDAPTSTMKELAAAGLKPGTPEYTKALMDSINKPGVTVNTGDNASFKVPANYMLVDPNDPKKGVVPIPGGPGEALPAEAAARMGLADSFQTDAPGITEAAKAGDLTGPYDVAKGKLGLNESYRKLQSGVDALTRMLTGAGMNYYEAGNYAKRYLPGFMDTPESTAQKIEQLSKELEATKVKVMRGHGTDTPAAGADDPLGIRN